MNGRDNNSFFSPPSTPNGSFSSLQSTPNDSFASALSTEGDAVAQLAASDAPTEISKYAALRARLADMGEKLGFYGGVVAGVVGIYDTAKFVSVLCHWTKPDVTMNQLSAQISAVQEKVDWLGTVALASNYQDDFAKINTIFNVCHDKLDMMESVIKSFDPSDSTILFKSDQQPFLDWFLGTLTNQSLSIHQYVENILFDTSTSASLLNFFDDETGGGGTGSKSYLDVIAAAWQATFGTSTGVAAKDKVLVTNSLADLFEIVYFQCLQILRRAQYLHDVALGFAAPQLFGPNARTLSPAQAKVAASLKGNAVDAQSFLQQAAFANHFANPRENDLAKIDWQASFGSRIKGWQKSFNEKSAYAYNWNIATFAGQSECNWPKLYHFGDISIADSEPTAFVTGLRLRTRENPQWHESSFKDQNSWWEYPRYLVHLEAHFSKMLANGQCRALGWYPKEPPLCDTQCNFVRVGDFAIADLQAAVDRANGQEMLVMQSIGFASSGTLDGQPCLGLRAKFGRLMIALDGAGVSIAPFGGSETGERNSQYSAKNYLRISATMEDANAKHQVDVKYIEQSNICRQLDSGEPDPSGIIVNAMVLRDSPGSTLYLRAQVNAPFYAMPSFRAVDAKPFRYDLTRALPAGSKVTSLGLGDPVDSGKAATRLTSNGAADTTTAGDKIRLIMGSFGCRLVLGTATTDNEGNSIDWSKIKSVNYDYLLTLPPLRPLVSEGYVFQVNSIPNVYIIQNGQRYWITDAAQIPGGYTAVQRLPTGLAAHIALIPLGGTYAPPAVHGMAPPTPELTIEAQAMFAEKERLGTDESWREQDGEEREQDNTDKELEK